MGSRRSASRRYWGRLLLHESDGNQVTERDVVGEPDVRSAYTAASFGAQGAAQVQAKEAVVQAGRTIPVRFRVVRADGTLVVDQSVRVDLVDAGGATVAGPQLFATTPDSGVVVQGDVYHANLSTRGVAPGHYTLRASFASPTLVGSLELPLTLR